MPFPFLFITFMKYLIVGLGNVGEEYWGTRHNIGFRIVNTLVEKENATFTEERYGAVARLRIKNCEVIILKPNTYMNLSGTAVRYWMQKEKIQLENILVAVDDLSLPFGTIRIKSKGSDGGHNGLKNITAMLGTDGFTRLRFGLGNDFPRGGQIDYVLGHFPEDQEKILPDRLGIAIDAIRCFCLSGVENAMNQYNNK